MSDRDIRLHEFDLLMRSIRMVEKETAKARMTKECIDYAEGDKETAVELAKEVYEYFLNLSELKFREKGGDAGE